MNADFIILHQRQGFVKAHLQKSGLPAGIKREQRGDME